jgi:hypothetical protein
MDEEDEPIQPKKLPWTEGALAYYKSINKYAYLMFDRVDFNDNGIAIVRLTGKWNWFSFEKQEVLSPNQWFDWVGEFDSNGIAVVELNGKWTWFSAEKQDYLFQDKWFDEIKYFDSNGIVVVRLTDKWTWLSAEKQDYLFQDKWFDWVDYFDNKGIAYVLLNGKNYYFTLDGQLLDYNTKQPLSDEELQQLSSQQQIEEMVSRLVRNYLR